QNQHGAGAPPGGLCPGVPTDQENLGEGEITKVGEPGSVSPGRSASASARGLLPEVTPLLDLRHPIRGRPRRRYSLSPFLQRLEQAQNWPCKSCGHGRPDRALLRRTSSRPP